MQLKAGRNIWGFGVTVIATVAILKKKLVLNKYVKRVAVKGNYKPHPFVPPGIYFYQGRVIEF